MLELLREEKTAAQIAFEYGAHPTMLSQWKKAALEGFPELFEPEGRMLRKAQREHDEEKDQLHKKIGQLEIDLDWLKKNLKKYCSSAERRAMIDRDHERLSRNS